MDTANIPGLLDDPSELEMFLRRLQLQGMYQTQNTGPLALNTYGGRVGYNQPLDDKSGLSVGLSGMGAQGNYAGNKFGQDQITGVDATYYNGPHSLSARFDQKGMMSPSGPPMRLPVGMGPTLTGQTPGQMGSISPNLLQLLYRYNF